MRELDLIRCQNLFWHDTMATISWSEGLQVRLKGDPGQTGTCTGRTRPRGNTLMVQVRFGGGPASMYPEYELDRVENPAPDDDEAIRTGRFGRAADLRRQLTHIQLSGRLANLVYSMDTTNTDFYAHQYKPVLSFLESPSNGLLIADEVGLGKTIEAGLIWTELRARVDARRLLVVCPKMLCPKWKSELLNRFGAEASIVDPATLLEELQKPKDQVADGRALIASMQGIRPPKGWKSDEENNSSRYQLARFLAEHADQEPTIDLVVIDEAHYLRNPETSTHELGLLLRSVTEHIILLSATPLNLKNEDLFSQLTIVDPDNFRYSEQFQSVLKANEPLVRARLVALTPGSSPHEILVELEHARAHDLLVQSRQLDTIFTELSGRDANSELKESDRVILADRIERVNLLSRAVTRTRKVEVTENKVIRDAKVQVVPMSTEETSLYSLVTEAIRQYADDKGTLEGFLLAMPQRQLSSCMYAAAKYWHTPSADDDEEQLYEDLDYYDGEGDRSEFLNHLASYIAGSFSLAGLRANDSKFNAFSKILIDFFADYPAEKVVVFSYFRETLRYLHERLDELRIPSMILMGGTAEKTAPSKTQIIDNFRTDPKVRVLLSSEVASEGVDLQFSRFLINYDLPWNPMKVEQRIGRIDRLGQESEKIFIWNLVYDDTIDSRILTRLYTRLNLFERALGGLEAIIGDEIQNLTNDLLTGRLTRDEEEARIAKTALALENRRRSEEELEQQAGQLIAEVLATKVSTVEKIAAVQ
jgi:SNF2 family DNA or RNA helicase